MRPHPNLRLILALSTALIFPLVSAHADDTLHNDLSSGHYSPSCYDGTTFSMTSPCFEKDYTGQTFGVNPLVATVHAKLMQLPRATDGNRYMSVVLKITQIQDSTNVYNLDGSLPVLVRTKQCWYHRDCQISWQSASVVMPRIYGTRTFSQSDTISVKISANDGGEQVESVNEADLWLPMQAFPIVINF